MQFIDQRSYRQAASQCSRSRLGREGETAANDGMGAEDSLRLLKGQGDALIPACRYNMMICQIRCIRR